MEESQAAYVTFILLAENAKFSALHSIRSSILSAENRLTHMSENLVDFIRSIRRCIPDFSTIRRH